jgi:hypothetical protein
MVRGIRNFKINLKYFKNKCNFFIKIAYTARKKQTKNYHAIDGLSLFTFWSSSKPFHNKDNQCKGKRKKKKKKKKRKKKKW